LNKQILGFDTNGQGIKNKVPNSLSQIFGFKGHGHGMVIDHAIDASVLVLKIDPILNSPEVPAQVEIAGGLHSGKNLLSICCCAVGHNQV
jgi:hypothetical protein